MSSARDLFLCKHHKKLKSSTSGTETLKDSENTQQTISSVNSVKSTRSNISSIKTFASNSSNFPMLASEDNIITLRKISSIKAKTPPMGSAHPTHSSVSSQNFQTKDSQCGATASSNDSSIVKCTAEDSQSIIDSIKSKDGNVQQPAGGQISSRNKSSSPKKSTEISIINDLSISIEGKQLPNDPMHVHMQKN
jgi:hypothetical protein